VGAGRLREIKWQWKWRCQPEIQQLIGPFKIDRISLNWLVIWLLCFTHFSFTPNIPIYLWLAPSYYYLIRSDGLESELISDMLINYHFIFFLPPHFIIWIIFKIMTGQYCQHRWILRIHQLDLFYGFKILLVVKLSKAYSFQIKFMRNKWTTLSIGIKFSKSILYFFVGEILSCKYDRIAKIHTKIIRILVSSQSYFFFLLLCAWMVKELVQK
jgi:hypothetical protein